MSHLIYVIGLQNNILFLHASSIYINDKVIVFVGPPNSGKTALALLLSKEYGAELLSEDITPCILTDDGIMFIPNLYTTTFLKNPRLINVGLFNKSEMMRLKLDNAIGSIPIVPFFLTFSNQASYAYKLLDKYKIHNQPVVPKQVIIVFLERDAKKEANEVIADIKAHAIKDYLDSFLFQNRAEVRYWSDPVLFLLSRWNSSFDITHIANRESRAFMELLTHSKCFKMRLKDDAQETLPYMVKFLIQ
jgi:hypothetical protein